MQQVFGLPNRKVEFHGGLSSGQPDGVRQVNDRLTSVIHAMQDNQKAVLRRLQLIGRRPCVHGFKRLQNQPQGDMVHPCIELLSPALMGADRKIGRDKGFLQYMADNILVPENIHDTAMQGR